MASLAEPPPLAAEIARGVGRWLWRAGIAPMTEVPLGNGRRADILGLGPDGCLVLIEIKVSLADLRGDFKWPEYLDYCDRFCWAVPTGFPLTPFDEPWFQPGRAGLLVADRWDAAELRAPVHFPIAAARRKAETLRFARRAAQRLLWSSDPGVGEPG